MSNDPDNPRVSLSIEGEIVVDVAVKPSPLLFGERRKRDKAEKEFFVTVNEPEKIKITSVTIKDERFVVARKSKDNENDNLKYELKFLGSDKLGHISANIDIAFEGSESSSVSIPVRVHVIGDLRYSKNIYFLKRDGEFKSREVILSTRSGNSVKIKGVEDPDKQLKLEIVKAVGPRVTVRAEVADPDGTYKKPSHHKFYILTSDQDEPKAEIGYTITEPRTPTIRKRSNLRTIKPSSSLMTKTLNAGKKKIEKK